MKKKAMKSNRRYKVLFKDTTHRYYIMMGGRGAGRSYAASQFALAKLRDTSAYFRCAIMRFVLSDIRNSIFQEIEDRIEENEINDVIVREPTLQFECGTNLVKGIGFRKSSSDQKSKLKSLAAFNCVIIEEADEVAEEDFMQLDDSLRTIKGDIKIILLLNAPDKNHWIIRRWFNLVPSDVPGFYLPQLKESEAESTIHIRTDYLNNKRNIAQITAANFERYKETRPDHYWNMIKGFVSEGKRGRIFKDWQPTTNAVYDQLPFTETFGLDFGFSNDPAALIGIKRHNKKAWAREYVYEPGLTNSMLSKRMEELGIPKTAVIYADSAEPKSIAELRGYGWDIRPAEKGEDSVRAGIDLLLDYEFFYTEESTNVAKENQEYQWALDRNKEPTNTPIDAFNHAMDAIRYNVWTDTHQTFIGFV